MERSRRQLTPPPLLDWWHQVVSTVDHQEVMSKVREDGGWSSHFAIMTLLSAGIAVLGLLLSSPAVVIGAMLISPLMGPIIGLGFALATFDWFEMRRSLHTLVIGVILAVGFCALIVLLSPLRSLTDEIAARTRPNLFDLLIALFSGLAGTYAMIRGRHGTIVGVAIATALMPPIAVVGFGLATQNWTVLAGSSLLFFTNLMTIAAAAAVLARVYGFAPGLSPHQTRLQVTLITVLLVGLAIPLGLSLKQIAWEALASREARQIIADEFGGRARLSELDVDYRTDPIEVSATVLTPRLSPNASKSLTERLSQRLGRPVDLSIDQLKIDGVDSEALELANATKPAADKVTRRLADQLAIAAGVEPDQILIDRSRKRMDVRAAALPGATLESYRELEARVAASDANWSINLIPPLLPLGTVRFDKDGVREEDKPILTTALWAAHRLQLPVGVTGGARAQRDSIATMLRDQGVDVRTMDRNGREVTLTWFVPESDSKPAHAR